MTHLTFDEINDLAESGRESAHVAECDECRGSLERVRQLIAAARALPRDIAPPPEAWRTIRDRIGAQPRAASASRWWHSGWLATAAALLLVLGTATFTLMLSRAGTSKAKAVMTSGPSSAASVLFTVDKNYAVTIRELRATLEAQRSTLAPATVQSVERSLKVIDDAIAEARAALAADPANQALVDILASHYERQVDLLQRATELSSSL